MTQIERLKLRIPEEPDENVLLDLLESARETIMVLRFPHGDWPDDVEPQYKGTQIDMAVDIYNRRGAEGQVGHSENGVSRSWGAEWVSDELKRRIVPMCKVL